MLEFPNEFFRPEIREGFFVDSTMKTVWAAELEVLQAVAEVCEKYGLTWYACGGTLLGAIRHEGFIPWDDDIDIMMMRKDYMKLMNVLPKELPDGYLVRSPLTEVGYSEFHTCVINNNGISTVSEFLRKFHNCPFSVGMDIYPLDYLPRNEGERIIQKNLLSMTCRVVNMARYLKGKEEIDECDKEMTREDYLTELKYGMEQLEELCKVKLDYSPVEEERWGDLISQMRALANKIAMIYGPEDSDVIVAFGYWDQKQFQKKWFQEVYGATFENFMVPIPNGYDEYLRMVYGDYHVRVKGDATHEYPLYAKQLRYLREVMKGIEDKAEKIGFLTVEERNEALRPKDWYDMLNGRKVILFSDDIQLYAEFGGKALDKLENILNGYKEKCNEILLWWRPQEQLKTLLGLLSNDLVERYDKILKTYKEESWGICDESHDEDRAMEYCDEYYGGMGYIAKSLHDKKSVTLERMED